MTQLIRRSTVLALVMILCAICAYGNDDIPTWLSDLVIDFAGLDSVVSASQSVVVSTHMEFYDVRGFKNINGVDRDISFMVIGDETSHEVVAYLRLCPRYNDYSTEPIVDETTALNSATDYLINHSIDTTGFGNLSMPASIELIEDGMEWCWHIRWQHEFDAGGVPGIVLPDFMLIEVDAVTSEVIAFSKVYHGIATSQTPVISEEEAIIQATNFAAPWFDFICGDANSNGTVNLLDITYIINYLYKAGDPPDPLEAADVNNDGSINILDITYLINYVYKGGPEPNCPSVTPGVIGVDVDIVYPNNYFDNWLWEWSENQALCWNVHLGDPQDSEPILDIWIDAVNGGVLGGEMYWGPSGHVYGIPNLQDKIDPLVDYLNMMKYDITSSKGNTNENTITTSIADADDYLFIINTHGGYYNGTQVIALKQNGTTDAQLLSPDEVPTHTLHYAYLGACHSGDNTGANRFKKKFIEKSTADYFVFHGYLGTVNPEDFQKHFFRHLAEGDNMQNAHKKAKNETGFDKAVFAYTGVYCYNQIRLAPLFVKVEHDPDRPLLPGEQFDMKATVSNHESAGNAQGENVKAKLIIPDGFTLVSGNVQHDLGNINYNASTTTVWQVKVNIGTLPGTYVFDVEVWSDNLGVEVDDPDDPYHKHEVEVVVP
jgi:hypothetical protein